MATWKQTNQLIVLISFLFCAAVHAADGRARPGLIAEYSDGAHGAITIVATPDFVLNEKESIHPQLSPEFKATWTGVLMALKRGKYTLSSSGDAAITLDGQEAAGKEMTLEAGEHPLVIHYARKPGGARLELFWRSEFFPEEPLPSNALGHRVESPELRAALQAEHGRDLVEHLNCVACHHAASPVLASHAAPDLSHVGSRAQEFWIYKWLENPRHFRPQTAMPAFTLADQDRRDLASYLGTLKQNKRVKEEPAQPRRIEKGRQLFETVGCTACHGRDGLSLNGMGSKTTPGQLTVYLVDPVAVDPSGRMPSMLLKNEEAEEIADYLVQSKNPEFEGKLAGGDAKNGEKLFHSQGCLACHTAAGIASDAPAAPDFEKLGAGKGCLADAPAGKAVRYDLSKEDRDAIGSFIAAFQMHGFVSRAPVYELPRLANEMRCVKCHELDASHPTDVDEVLPQLTDAGARLRWDWMKGVLVDKSRARAWYKRRMPDFGPANVGDVAAMLVGAAGVGNPDEPMTPTREQIAQGQMLMGTAQGGLGCLACHSFNNVKPTVIDAARGPEMTTAVNRLRPEFFRRWMRDPKRIQPATAMPSFFLDTPADQTQATITALWAYASLGSAMPAPRGFIDKENYTLTPGSEPLVMRCNLPAEGKMISHGIAVALPGGTAYGFDAETCQLRLGWVGGFLDMQPVWSGRGGGVARLLGRTFFKSNYFPLTIGDTGAAPTAHFDGYDFEDKIPIFLYRVDGVPIREKITPREGATGLTLDFAVEAAGKSVTFTMPEDARLTYTCSAGPMIPSKGVAGAQQVQSITIPADKAQKFTITITVKEGK